MAKNQQQEANSTYDPDARYEVQLVKPVTRKGRTLSPMNRHVMKGRVLNEIPSEAVGNVKPL